VDDVETEDERDVQPRPERSLLDQVDVLDPDEVEHRADLPALREPDQAPGRAVRPVRPGHLELAELLVHGHLVQQCRDLRIDRLPLNRGHERSRRARRPRRSGEAAPQQQDRGDEHRETDGQPD
jgi:hypothetical protein